MANASIVSNDQAPQKPWIRKAILLSWFTIFYNLIEGTVSIFLGISDGSTSLLGFGVDSLIEVASAILVLWRFREEIIHAIPSHSVERERKATKGIGVFFLGLAAFTLITASFQLKTSAHPTTTIPGIIVSAVSLSFMYYLWRSKRKTAQALSSSTMAKDAACSLACLWLSGILFVGSIVFTIFPLLWWVDGVASLILSILIGKEGLETYRAANSEEFQGGCCG